VQQYAESAYAFFLTYSVLQLLGVLLVAPALTAGTIAGERERRTIEYLFATDLSNWEIVIGKLSASLLRSIGLLLVGPPVLALAMWMGGVGPDRLLGVLVVTLSTLVVVTSLSLAVSVWSPRARQAFGRVYFYLIVLLAVPPIIYIFSFAGVAGVPPWLQPWLNLLFRLNRHLMSANPFYVLTDTLNASFGATMALWETIGTMLLYHGALSAMCVGTSLVAVRRVHLRAASLGSRPERRLRERHVSEQRPMLWKELNTERTANKLGMLGKALLVLLAIGFAGLTSWMLYLSSLASTGGDHVFTNYVATIGTVIECAAVLFVGMRGATAISAEKERDTLPTLLTTPLEPSEIIAAKWLAALYSLRWLALCLAALWLIGAVVRPVTILSIPGLALSFAATAGFSAVLGIWFSLWCTTSTRALGATLGTLIFLGGGYMFLGACCLSLIGASGDETMILGLAPWILFLLVLPNYVPEALEELGRRTRWNDDGVFLVIAYGLGIMGYLATTGVLAALSTAFFDRLLGRVSTEVEVPPDSRGGVSRKGLTRDGSPFAERGPAEPVPAVVSDEMSDSDSAST
jgi:ABC-type transport system involved in multi-copper enzyme maturation permease subunit